MDISEFVNGFINYQIAWLASSLRSAIIFVTALNVLIVYVTTLHMRKKISQTEFLLVIAAIAVASMIVLEFTGGPQ